MGVIFLLLIFIIFPQSSPSNRTTFRYGLKDSQLANIQYHTGNTFSRNQTKHEDVMCFKENEVKTNIDEKDQIFIVMPQKAGGTAMREFARKCYGGANYQNGISPTPEDGKKFLTQSYDTPNLLIGHIWTGKRMESLLKGASKESLIVYIHREETSRLVAAIKQVMKRFCGGRSHETSQKFEFLQRNDTDHNTCTIEENGLVDKVIHQSFLKLEAVYIVYGHVIHSIH